MRRRFADLGVCHGDRVAVLTINVPEFLEVLFACGKLGCGLRAVELPPGRPRALLHRQRRRGAHDRGGRRVHRAGRFRAPGAVRAPLPRAAGRRRAATGSVYDDVVSRAAALASDNEVSTDEVAIIMYTSGTTGPAQGRHAHPRQPALEQHQRRAGLRHTRGRHHPRLRPALPHRRAQRDHAHHAAQGGHGGAPAGLRPRQGARSHRGAPHQRRCSAYPPCSSS